MIIVTGASRGLGRAVAESLVEAGREVLGISRETEGLPFEALACDVSDYGALKTIAQNLRKEKIEVEGLVNAAGICLLYTSPSPRDATLSRMPSSA